MEGLFKEVIIKEVSENAAPDKVFIVENLPKKFLLKEMAETKNVRISKGNVDEVPTGRVIEVPHDGIEYHSRDGSYVFYVGLNAAKDRLEEIDRYIEATFPKDQRLPKRIYNSSDLSSTRAYPLMKEDMPRVVLPVLTLPTQVSPSTVPVAPEQSVDNSKNVLSDEQIAEYKEMKAKKEAAKERMAAARAAKA